MHLQVLMSVPLSFSKFIVFLVVFFSFGGGGVLPVFLQL